MTKIRLMEAASAQALAFARKRPEGLQTRDDPTPTDGAAAKKAIEALNTAFAEFRKSNDERIAAVEKRGSADVLIEERTNKINAAITELNGTVTKMAERLDAEAKRADDLELRLKRPGAPGKDEDPNADPEYRAEFLQFIRRGDVGKALEKRAMSASDNTEGGYLTNIEVDRELAKVQRDMSVARQLFTVRQIGAGAFKKPVSKSNANSGWVGEMDGRPQTNASDLGEINIATHEIYANVGATQTILDDAFINLEQFIAEETAAAFEDAEGAAFFLGDGVSKPKGILTMATQIEAAGDRADFGTLGIVKSGSVANFGAQADKFIDVIGYLRAKYRQNAQWVYNALTEATIRKIKDGDNNYIWQPTVTLGTPSTLLGYSSVVADHMPDIADGAIPVLFGDTRRAYTIVDRVGMRTLRDPFTAKPYVLFYVTKRVGGGVTLSEAVKGLSTAV